VTAPCWLVLSVWVRNLPCLRQMPLNNGYTWLVYSSAAATSTFTAAGDLTLTGPVGFTGSWRFAVSSHAQAVPYGWTASAFQSRTASFEGVLDSYKEVVPTGE
jgi:hypothetical protein